MTETYHGPWNSVTGDKPEKRVAQDVYHRYPAPEVKAQASQSGKAQNAALASIR